MKLRAIVVIVGALWCAGCSVTAQGLGSSSTVIPPRPADARYPRWEHYCSNVSGPGEERLRLIAKVLNDAGDQGWELVTSDFERSVFCFKRPIEEPAAETPPATSELGYDDDADAAKRQALYARGIKKAGDNRFDISRELFTAARDDQALARGARMVPWMVEGKPRGFKIYAIRPGSLYAHLGFANGDAIVEINGFVLDTAERALEVFEKLREATSFEVVIERRGARQTLLYSVR